MISDVILDIANDYVDTSINKVPGPRKGFFRVNDSFVFIKCLELNANFEIDIERAFLDFLNGWMVKLSDSCGFFIIFCLSCDGRTYKLSLGLSDFFAIVKYPKVSQKVKLTFFNDGVRFSGITGDLYIRFSDHYLDKVLGYDEDIESFDEQRASSVTGMPVTLDNVSEFINFGEFKINCIFETNECVIESRLDKTITNKDAVQNTYNIFFRGQEFTIGYFMFSDNGSDHLRLLSAPEEFGVNRLENGLRMGVKKLYESDFINPELSLSLNGNIYGIELSQARIKDDGKWSNAFSASKEQLAFGVGFDSFDALCSHLNSEVTQEFLIGFRKDILKNNGSKANYLYCVFSDKLIIPVVMYIIAKLAPLCYGIHNATAYKRLS